ncbi:hypothetical protein LUZ62_068204 [Rhynchospora pubera]|uniref:Aminotransferase-like plant mobile domain-containing protein n=1 Tax=Rhynchospora pubera TaxID=906938 RepID=A0AAV8CPU4_9POAL|nr:hypothetical protein LUZ62_068204 [Rhynchospora pubera]
MPKAALSRGNIATTSADRSIVDIPDSPTDRVSRHRPSRTRRQRTDGASLSQLVGQGEPSHGVQDGPDHQRLLFIPPEEHRSHMAQTDPVSQFQIKFLHAKPELELYDQIVPHLKAVGLYHCTMFRHFMLDHALLTALTERWRPETHTFHMPCGEMTITLEDVAYMLGLPIDGSPVKGDIQTEWSGEVLRLLGIELDGQARSYIRLHQLRKAISEQGPLTDDSGEDVITQYARAFILELFGCLLFPYSSKKYVRCYYLPLLEDLSGETRYSWGSAVLAFLYRQLDDSVLLSQGRWRKTIGGANILLQLWCWTRFSIGRPTSIQYDKWGQPDLQSCGPYGCYWIGNREHRRTPFQIYRDEFERVTENMVDWTPYLAYLGWMPEMVQQEIQNSIWFARVPLVHFTVVEWHYPDRVMRQFGFRQPNPPPLPKYWTEHEKLRKIKDPITSIDDVTSHQDACEKWNERTRIRTLGPYERGDHKAYMRWYGIYGMKKLKLVGN